MMAPATRSLRNPCSVIIRSPIPNARRANQRRAHPRRDKPGAAPCTRRTASLSLSGVLLTRAGFHAGQDMGSLTPAPPGAPTNRALQKLRRCARIYAVTQRQASA